LLSTRAATHHCPVSRPQTAYAWNDSTALAYQVVGSSGPDLLFVPGSVTHIEMLWEHPRVSRFLDRLAGFCRLILMDPRGLGLSDRLTEVPTLEERVADMMAVLDAAGSQCAALFGNSDTGPACIATAVLHQERVGSLILCGTFAKGAWSEDYPMGGTEQDWADFRDFVKRDWGKAGRRLPPSDEAFRQWWATMMRVGASPRAVLLLGEMTQAVDVRPMLARVSVPTLVMHRVGETVNPVEHGRYLARHIPGARWVELPGDEFELWAGDIDAIADEVEEFLTGTRSGAEPARTVATVLFTDIVRSTERAAEAGDRAWAELVELHHQRVRAELRRFSGREIDTAGDGFLASFDSPTLALMCAHAILKSVAELGVDLRIGVHTGECEIVGGRLRGIALHIGARIGSQAEPREILVSQTVKDLVTGSEVLFADRGTHELRGVPGEWHLYAVESPNDH
jgi:class 3 adenylate cyclase